MKGGVTLGTVALSLRIMSKVLGGRPSTTEQQMPESRGAGEAPSPSALNLLPLQGAARSPGRGALCEGEWGAVICQLCR